MVCGASPGCVALIRSFQEGASTGFLIYLGVQLDWLRELNLRGHGGKSPGFYPSSVKDSFRGPEKEKIVNCPIQAI